MKNFICLLLAFIFILPPLFIMAQEGEEEEVPPGMEVIKIGDVRAIVIIGSKIKKQGDLLILEGTKEFVARKFIETDKRISELEAKGISFEKELEQLRKELKELEESNELIEEDLL